MHKYGLIGFPLSHSFSPEYFRKKFEQEQIHDAVYSLYPLSSIRDLPMLIKKENDLIGLNVTIPYKKQVIPFTDYIDPVAESVGAVNTIKIIRENVKILLHGFNTDVFGFENALKPFLKTKHNHALVLGSGGAASAICYVLTKTGIEYLIVSRTPEQGMISYEEANKNFLKNHLLIINTTPLGRHPVESTYPPIDYGQITPDHLLFDLTYNPAETVFMKKGKEKGATVTNGQKMLELQAEESWHIWQINNA